MAYFPCSILRDLVRHIALFSGFNTCIHRFRGVTCFSIIHTYIDHKLCSKPAGVPSWSKTSADPSYISYSTTSHVPSRATCKTCRHKAMTRDDEHSSYFMHGIKPHVPSRASHKTCRHKAVTKGIVTRHVTCTAWSRVCLQWSHVNLWA
jgi:hypothetical protein